MNDYIEYLLEDIRHIEFMLEIAQTENDVEDVNGLTNELLRLKDILGHAQAYMDVARNEEEYEDSF